MVGRSSVAGRSLVAVAVAADSLPVVHIAVARRTGPEGELDYSCQKALVDNYHHICSEPFDVSYIDLRA